MAKCKVCKKQCVEDSMFVYNGLDVYCCSEECFTSFLCKEKEKESRNLCYATISRIFGVRPLTGKLLAEVKRTCENEGLSYKQLASVLHYMYEVKRIPIFSPTLYYVPKYVDEARDYFAAIAVKEKDVQRVAAHDKKLKETSSIVKPNYNLKKRKTGLKINPEDV